MTLQRIGGLTRAATGDMAAAGRRGQDGLLARFLAQVPADLPDREHRAHLLYRAHMARIGRRSAQVVRMARSHG